MKILIASKKGINDLVNDTLRDLPVNKRYERVDEVTRNEYPTAIKIQPIDCSYRQTLEMPDKQMVPRTIDIIGQYDEVPNFMIAKNKKNKQEIESGLQEDVWSTRSGYWQTQLVVLDNGIFLRDLYSTQKEGLKAITVQTAHFNSKEADTKFNQSIWETTVTAMTEYFIARKIHNYGFPRDSKVIYGSERCKDKVIEVFEKMGLTKVEKK